MQGTRQRLQAVSPVVKAESQAVVLSALKGRTRQVMRETVNRLRARLNVLSEKISALSPVAILDRGYSITINQKTGEVIRSSSSVRKSDIVVTRLGEGQIKSRVCDDEDC